MFNPGAGATTWDNSVHFEDACPAVGNHVTAWKLAVIVRASYPFLSTGFFGQNIKLKETVVIDLEPTSTAICTPS